MQSLLTRWFARWAATLLLACAALGNAQACSSSACVTAGPRLASVDSGKGALLNLLLGNLTGSTLSLSVADWNAIATGDLSLLKTVNALQATLGVSSPTTALSTNASVAQVIAAAATAATGDNRTSLALALNALQAPLQLIGGSIRLGDLLQTDGALGTTRINALALVSGVVQLYNTKNVLTTPQPVTVSGSSLGIPGLASSVTLSAQVVEPPVYVCGPVGSSFHSATMRIKLGLDLLSINLDSTLLKAIPLVGSASAQVTRLDLYLEVAHADGIISSVNAIGNAFSVQATPGVASLYLGTISDTLFYNRGRAINPATDLGWAAIGAVSIDALSVGIFAKAAAIGAAPSASTLAFSGPYPQGYTVSAGAAFVPTLLSSLVGNLQISLGSGLGSVLGATVSAILQPIVQLAVSLVISPLVTGLVDPLLDLLGIGLGEVEVTAGGTVLACTIAGSVYDDADHSARMEAGEAGTGATLYAKLLPSASPAGPATAVATVNPATGAYSFAGVSGASSYIVVVNGSASASQVTPAAPAGWLPIETPTLSLATTLAAADVSGQRFGLYHGSKLAGTVFKDDGSGGGIANNGLRDGGEAGLPGAALKVVNAAGGTVYDSTSSGSLGAWTAWVPFTAGTATLKVVHAPTAEWLAISGRAGTTAGAWTQPDASVTFTHASGSSYSGIDFGDVPLPRFEPDGQQQVLPGSVAFFAHTFTAGSAGQLGLAASGSGAAGWSVTLHADADCNGRIDAADLPVATAVPMVAGQKLCLVGKVVSPAAAAYNSRYTVALTAHFAYANSSVASDLARSDVVTIGTASDAALRLAKSVDKASASIGELITYTISYTNNSKSALTTIRIVDATPAYTAFAAAACGAVPNAAIACAVGSLPAVGASGRIEWVFTGSLAAGATGSVSFSVRLQ